MSEISKRVIIGIDLGTSYSLVSCMLDGRPVIIPNALGERLTPSAVSLDDDGKVLIGAPAKARATTHPEDTFLAFKRDMGTDRTFLLGDREVTPRDLSAYVLRTLKDDAESFLGRSVDEAIVTVPAYFGDHQRQATKDAGAIAGMLVERMINEPTAAALAFGLNELDIERKVVVLDLGGGTFDVTVLEIIEGIIEIQSSAGDSALGGEDFVDVLEDHFNARIDSEYGSLEIGSSLARLHEGCEQVKRRLTSEQSARLVLPMMRFVSGEELDVELEITRSAAEELWADLLDRVRRPTFRALREAGLEPSQVDEVLLVGGATRMPCIVGLAAKIFGRMPNRDLPPDEAVAVGAAVQAALKAGDEAVEDLVVTDVAPFTMGISTGAKMGAQFVDGIFTPIIERGTVIPASREQRFYTMADFQRELLIEVFQGEHTLCADNRKLGEYNFRGLPRGRAGKVFISVRFTYDLNGILEVELSSEGKSRPKHLVIENRSSRLSKKQITEARKAMSRIKFHPREALPNKTALNRADALYVELTGLERQALAEALATFRAILELQDPALIADTREELLALVATIKLQH